MRPRQDVRGQMVAVLLRRVSDLDFRPSRIIAVEDGSGGVFVVGRCTSPLRARRQWYRGQQRQQHQRRLPCRIPPIDHFLPDALCNAEYRTDGGSPRPESVHRDKGLPLGPGPHSCGYQNPSRCRPTIWRPEGSNLRPPWFMAVLYPTELRASELRARIMQSSPFRQLLITARQKTGGADSEPR